MARCGEIVQVHRDIEVFRPEPLLELHERTAVNRLRLFEAAQPVQDGRISASIGQRVRVIRTQQRASDLPGSARMRLTTAKRPRACAKPPRLW